MGLKKKDNQFCRLFKKGDGNLEIIHTSILIYTHGCYLWCYLHFAFFYLSFKFSTINNYYFCNKFLKKKKRTNKSRGFQSRVLWSNHSWFCQEGRDLRVSQSTKVEAYRRIKGLDVNFSDYPELFW